MCTNPVLERTKSWKYQEISLKSNYFDYLIIDVSKRTLSYNLTRTFWKNQKSPGCRLRELSRSVNSDSIVMIVIDINFGFVGS